MTEITNSKRFGFPVQAPSAFRTLPFSNFGFVSDFDIRISNLVVESLCLALYRTIDWRCESCSSCRDQGSDSEQISARQAVRALMGSIFGSVLTALLIGFLLPIGPAPTPLAAPSILLSQIIESSPKPPIEQDPTPPTLQGPPSGPVEQDASPRIEQNPTPPTEQTPMRPLEQMPTPPIQQSPTPPTQQGSSPPSQN
jgi:hypothetical protein